MAKQTKNSVCHIYVYGDIVDVQSTEEAEFFGCVSMATVRAAYEQNPDADEILVHIHSNGGSVYEGFAIHDYLLSLGKKITTVVEGMCASMATVLFLAGSERKITENARFLIHNPLFQEVSGNADDLEKYAAQLRIEQSKMLNFYVEKTGTSADVLQKYMNKDAMMDAAAALELKFATEILLTSKMAAIIINKQHEKQIIKSIINHKSKSKMEKGKKTKLNAFIASIGKLAKDVLALSDDEPQAGSRALEDGSELFFDGEQLAVGDDVFTDAEMTVAAADGDYPDTDGNVITVVEGAVTAIEEAPDADAETPEQTIARLTTELAAANALAAENETLATNAMDALEEGEKALAIMKTTWKPAARTAVPASKTKVAAIKDGEKGSLKAKMEAEKKKIAEAKAKKEGKK